MALKKKIVLNFKGGLRKKVKLEDTLTPEEFKVKKDEHLSRYNLGAKKA